MIWVAAGAAVLVGLVYLYSLFVSGEIRKLVRALRAMVGGLLILVALFFGLRGNMMVASLAGMAGFGVFMRGRLGPIDFGGGMSSPNTASSVKSAYLTMTLDHDTGSVSGSVRKGLFAGKELEALSAEECWALYDEVGEDPDSVALLESWLDANRTGWRDWFAEQFGMDTEAGPEREPAGRGLSGIDEAYEVLGLSPGASEKDIKAAHRKLMKKMHPDAGGSSFLAARINEAKDLLLKETQRRG